MNWLRKLKEFEAGKANALHEKVKELGEKLQKASNWLKVYESEIEKLKELASPRELITSVGTFEGCHQRPKVIRNPQTT